MTASTEWWWLRHAPVARADGRIFGQLDVGCDTSDTESFRVLAARLPCDAITVITPLRRTRETLEALIAAGFAAPDPIVESGLVEQHFGAWQGLGWEEMRTADPAAYARFWRDPLRATPPGGESYVALIGRTRAAIERLTRRHAGRTLLCIAHGGTIRAAVATALGLTPEAAMAIVVDNLSLTRLGHVKDGLLRGRGGVWRVDAVNVPCRWIGRSEV